MKNLDWTNNICTVGWTCIHGYFTLAELKDLYGLHPEGNFSPTFPGLNSYSPEEMFKSIEKQQIGDDERGYYFNLPWQGSEALVTFLLMHDIKMTPEVQQKAQDHLGAYWTRIMNDL
jgi:hypothetical protein